LKVRNKIVSAAIVIPVVMAVPTVAAADTPPPSPIVTDPVGPPIEPTPDPIQPAPESTPPPTVSDTTIPASNPIPTPATKRQRATKRTSRAGVSMRTRGVRYSPMSAVYRLMKWARAGRGGYRNGCLRLADDAYAPRGGRTGTALRQWYRAKRNGYGHRNRYAPIGAQLFWRTSNPAGHVATYVGRGLVVTNVGSGRVRIMPWRTLDRWGPYLGWAEPFYK
jgi:hypothetical protein